MPAQNRSRGDQAVVAQPRWQPPDQGGEDGAVSPVQAGSRVGAPEHGDLMSQHQQLDVLGGRRPSEQQEEPQNLLEEQI
jgi:hypothetical protein